MRVVSPYLRCTVVLLPKKWYFERFWRFRVRCLLYLSIDGQEWKLIFERLQRRGDFSPENHIAPLSNFAGEWTENSRFFLYLSLEISSKRLGAIPRRISKSHTFRAVEMSNKPIKKKNENRQNWSLSSTRNSVSKLSHADLQYLGLKTPLKTVNFQLFCWVLLCTFSKNSTIQELVSLV